MFKPFRIVIYFLTLVFASILAIPSIHFNPIQKKNKPELNIFYAFPSASPEIVEQLVTAPLENTFSKLSQLKKIKSESYHNQGHILLEFDNNSNLDIKRFEVTALTRQIYPHLNPQVSYPIIEENHSNSEGVKSPLLVYAISGALSPYELRQKAENSLMKSLKVISGISELEFTGSEEMQITVSFDQSRLNMLGLNVDDVLTSIKKDSKSRYLGTVMGEDNRLQFLKISGKINSINTLNNILIPTSNSSYIKLEKIADVYFEDQEPHRYSRVNGENSVNLNIYVQDEKNTLMIVDEIKEKIKLLSKAGLDYNIQLEFDSTLFLRKELTKNYKRTSLTLLILTLIIIISYRNYRYLIILICSLIINVAITILIIWCLKIDIHLYTLAGIAISFGIMIDNAIVMLDHYHHYRNRKIFLALLGATLTTITSLLITFILPEQERENLSDFVLIVSVALFASLVSALAFTPGIYELLIGMKKNYRFAKRLRKRTKFNSKIRLTARIFKNYQLLLIWLANYRKALVIIIVLLFGIPVFLLPASWQGQDWYNKSLGSEIYQSTVRPYVDVVLGGTSRLFFTNVYERNTYRNPEETKLYVSAEMPLGSTLDQMNIVINNVEKYLATTGGVEKYVAQIYSGQYGIIEITFNDAAAKSDFPYLLRSKLIGLSVGWAGVDWKIYGVGQGFATTGVDDVAQFKVRLKGYNYDDLEKQGLLLQTKLLKHGRIQNININEHVQYPEKLYQEYLLHLDQRNMSLMNLSTTEVFNQLHSLNKATAISSYIPINNLLYPVQIKEKNALNFSNWEMMNNTLPIKPGKVTKLRYLADLNLKTTNSEISKEGRQYIRIVSFEYVGSGKSGDNFLNQVLTEMKREMPIGYSAIKENHGWEYGKIERQYSLVLLLIAATFIICCILFESLRQPFFIIIIIPITFIGLFLTFGLFDIYFDQGGYAAFIIISGLVANSSIFIINDLNNNLIRTKNFNRKLFKTIVNRGRTIFITTMSACCGMIPFLIEGQHEVFWFALAAGTMGGLLMSMVTIFFILPILMFKVENSHLSTNIKINSSEPLTPDSCEL